VNPGLTEQESNDIDNGDIFIDGKGCRLLFKFGPIFTNNIRDRYVEFPEDIHLRITSAKAAGSGRIPQCVNLLRDLLFREKQQNRFVIERDEETLIRTLRLSKEWDAKKKSRVYERINKAIDIFTELGLLKSVVKTTGSKGQTKYILEINPDFK
jgi:tRNA 2-selenouridine synthase SelU